VNRKYSLKKQHIILNLLAKKDTVGNRNYVIYYNRTSDEAKIAISVSKKIGNAVNRNYQKRICREIVSQRLGELYGYSMLLVVKPSSNDLLFHEKEAQINFLLNKIINKKGDKNEKQS